ncbi:glycosyltransferase family 39 protein [candidate division FCPU426 bacterium]|nr:glycosyltransferase family 39 protein [candidate division FCPU426 bacterium]
MKKQYWILTGILGLAAGLRLFDLGAHSLWVDEMAQVMTARASWKELFGQVSTHLSPPLDYMLLKIFAGSGASEWWVRFPAVCYSLIAVYLVYLWAQKLANDQTAGLAALLLAMSPMAVAYAQEARMYSLLLMLALLSYVLAWLFYCRPNWKSALALGLVNGLVLLTHYFGFFMLLAETAFLGIAVSGLQARRRYYALLSLATALPGALFLPWLPIFLQQIKNSGGEIFYGLVADKWFIKFVLNAFSIHTGGEEGFWYYLYLMLMLGGVATAVIKGNRRMAGMGGMLVLLFAGFYCASFFKKVVTTRNLIFLLPVYLLLCAYLLERLLARWKYRQADVVLLAATALLLWWPLRHYYTGGRPDFKPDWKGASSYLQERMQNGETVWVFGPVTRATLAYYLDNDAAYAFTRPRMYDSDNRDDDLIRVIPAGGSRFDAYVKKPGYMVLPPHPIGDVYAAEKVEQVTVSLGEPVKSFKTQGRGGTLNIYRLLPTPEAQP